MDRRGQARTGEGGRGRAETGGDDGNDGNGGGDGDGDGGGQRGAVGGGRWAVGGGQPVSYTHLDVYKRQVFYSTFNSPVPQGRPRRPDPLRPPAN